ncbi:uncharacterized protein LOC125004939 isoform X2 [Mugil cephalus]|uniref:uncharacterized protein LOC125004939 isoform X2 n=1 Tax=Mugil cephalus TaxID=48193 RepID=UPI001FB80868|nr:uncharacterized protein LOC125004939 isoform X2 [Mugil cephalus]
MTEKPTKRLRKTYGVPHEKETRRSGTGMKSNKKSDRLRGQTRITIGVAFPRWRTLKEEMGLRSDTAVALLLLDSYDETRTSQQESTLSSLRYERGYTTYAESEVTSQEDSFEEMEVTIDEDDCDTMENLDSTTSEFFLECEEEELEPWQKQTAQLHLKAEEDSGELSYDQTDYKPEPSHLQGNVVDTKPPELKTEAPEHVVLNSQVEKSSCGLDISGLIEDTPSVSRTAGDERESWQSFCRVTDTCTDAARSFQFMKYEELNETEMKNLLRIKNKLKPTVMINVGIMSESKKNGIKPIRGKTLPLRVEPQWSSEQLLAAAVKRLNVFNQDTEDGEYVLLYPDGSEIKTLPGTDAPFTIKDYKEAIGKAYQRITVYICALGPKTKSTIQRRTEKRFSKRKKKSNNTVMINVGIMSETKKNGIKPIRGKTLPLRVEPQWSSEQLLAAAVKRLNVFNQDTEDGEYVLLYPDGSEIKTLPGTDTPFTIKDYKDAIGKAYQRITVYVCALGPKTKSTIQRRRETEKESFSKRKKKSNNTVMINVGIMSETKKNGIKPIRGKTLPLRVEPQWSSEQLLAAAVKRLKVFNQDIEDGEYVLLYPDGSEINTLPGTDAPFTIKDYKEAIGKAYQRITVYISWIFDQP